jgi:hypothetical protein
MGDERALQIWVSIVAVSLATLVLAAGLVVGPLWADTSSAQDRVRVESVTGDTTVTITYTTDEAATEAVVTGVDPALSSATDGWAILERSELPDRLRGASTAPGSGVVGFGEWALVGSATDATVSIGAANLTVVSPAGRDVDPRRKAAFLRQFLSPYALDPDASEDVTLVAAPDALAHQGAMYSDDSGYVTIEAFWDGDVGSVWIHEYVHARQNFRLAPEMRWFREASAEYLSYRVLQEQYGEVSESDVRERLDAFPAHEAVVLSNRSTWAGSGAEYHVGSRLLAAIDAEIRADTDGKKTLFDVFRAMNRQDGAVSLADFVDIVEQRTGDDESWVVSAVRGNRPVEAWSSPEPLQRPR